MLGALLAFACAGTLVGGVPIAEGNGLSGAGTRGVGVGEAFSTASPDEAAPAAPAIPTRFRASVEQVGHARGVAQAESPTRAMFSRP